MAGLPCEASRTLPRPGDPVLVWAWIAAAGDYLESVEVVLPSGGDHVEIGGHCRLPEPKKGAAGVGFLGDDPGGGRTGRGTALAALRSGSYVPEPGERVAVVGCGANTDPGMVVR